MCMITKEFGKITSVKLGTPKDYGFLFGVEFTFSFGATGTCVGSGGKYMTNLGYADYTPTESELKERASKILLLIKKTMKDAKVSNFNDLVGKPVEVTLDNGWFSDFKILSEVI